MSALYLISPTFPSPPPPRKSSWLFRIHISSLDVLQNRCVSVVTSDTLFLRPEKKYKAMHVSCIFCFVSRYREDGKDTILCKIRSYKGCRNSKIDGVIASKEHMVNARTNTDTDTVWLDSSCPASPCLCRNFYRVNTLCYSAKMHRLAHQQVTHNRQLCQKTIW